MVQKITICSVVVLSICALALAAPAPQEFQSFAPQQDAQPRVVRQKYDDDGQGGYLFTYELDNGQIFSEIGTLKTIGDAVVLVKSGQYTFVGPDGQTYWVNYTADENGYHAQVGTGAGGIGPGGDAEVNPGSLKSLVG